MEEDEELGDPVSDCVFALAMLIYTLGQVRLMLTTHETDVAALGFAERCQIIQDEAQNHLMELASFGEAFDGGTDEPV